MYRNDPILKYFWAVNIFYIRMKTLIELIIARNFAEIHLKNRRIFNSSMLKLQMKLKSLTKLVINKNLSQINHNFDSVTESMYISNNTLDQ